MLLYSDEVVPGNQLSHDNHRKHWVIYYSFLQFGALPLTSEDLWFTIACKRSALLALALAGISQAFSAVLKHLFCESTSFHRSGLVLNAPDGREVRIFVKLSHILQDGDAHKRVWNITGDAGTRFCMLCRNVFAEKSGISAMTDESGEMETVELLTMSVVHYNDLVLSTDASIRATIQELEEARATDSAGDFVFRQQAYGFKYCPRSLLQTPALLDVVKPATQFMHDWMHAMVVHGAFNTIMFLMLQAMINAGFTDAYEQFSEFLRLWTWPKRSRMNSIDLANIFFEN